MDDFEKRLQRYRPAGPSPDLRARVVKAGRSAESLALQSSADLADRVTPLPEPGARGFEPSVRSALAWLPAAAALALTMVFYWLAANERQMLGAMFTPVPPIDQPVAAMSDMGEPQP